MTAVHLHEAWLQADLVNLESRLVHTVMRDRRPLMRGLDDPSSFSFTVQIKNVAFKPSGDYQFTLLVNDTFLHGPPIQV